MNPFVQSFKKALTFSIIGGIALLSFQGLSSCAAIQGPIDHEMTSDFGLLGFSENGGAETAQGRKGKHHRKGKHWGMKLLFQDLNLTDEQKAAFKQLHQDNRTAMKDTRPQMSALKEKFKTAFLGATFDKAALKQEVETAMAAHKGQFLDKMVNTLIKAHGILTPDQRVKLKTKLEALSQKMESFANSDKASKFKDHRAKHMEKMAQKLGLSESQKTQLKTLFESKKPDIKERMAHMKSVKTALFAELSKEAPSASVLKSILEPMASKMGSKLDVRLETMAHIHGILTPEQRQKWIEQMSQRGHHKKMRQHRNH